ncbi:MAG: GNAT family N-acetyltransferase [Candidatus Thiodiazotropha sp. (ex Lucinoma kastoroae)]|nr:GNAT family N-acetyltransferase [Candidatus Thiodiazotropha sp. (ex Rostrolucina anterorostrata)]MCU7846704.1 GNAT family N-acetyltransferase [Candidatus Thiodiazotropha sp. (ex Lucinoma kastoroae)]
MDGTMQVEFHSSIDELNEEEWDRLVIDDNPFLKHAFHAAMEHHDCVGRRFGWIPSHLVIREAGRIVGLSPLYIKSNSYGEFVFDHAWAEAYQRSGLKYYPKVISAAPYTPAFGERLLVDLESNVTKIRKLLVEATLQMAVDSTFSSMHWLFTTAEEGELLRSMGMLERLGVQFHWQNPGYVDFEHFLSQLTAKRRKNIRQERRKVSNAGIRFKVLQGCDVSGEEWHLFANFYTKTFEERYSLPTLNVGFFTEIGERMGDQVILVFAYDDDTCVAGALLYRSRSVLYGRHWGTLQHYDSLHFETCYYQGIEYAINHKLQRFEPGAQGEHKIWRGFLPTRTRSYHWINNPQFSHSIKDFLTRESPAMVTYHNDLLASSPFKQTTPEK